MAETAASTTPHPPQSTSRALPLLVALALFGLMASLFWRYTCDDSFITFRYVAHAAAGQGLCFNAGEIVEGYSNPLWVGLLVLGVKLGADVVVLGKLLGLLCGFGCLLLVHATLRRLQVAPTVAMLALVLLAPNAGLAYFSVSGMETALYALLLTATVYCFLVPGRTALWLGSALGLAAALTRPEGLGVMLALGAWRLWALRGRARPEVVAGWLAVLASLAGLAGFLLWRHAVFGDWLPNTYYAKPPGAFGTLSYLSPLGYIRGYLVDTGGGVLVALALGLLWRGLPAAPAARTRLALGAAALVLGVELALVWHARGDWMGLHRFLVPVTPLLVAWGLAGLSRLTPARPAVAAVALALAGLSFAHLLGTEQEFRYHRYPYNVMGGEDQKLAGEWLRRHFPPSTRLACKRIGGIAYYSDLRLVDSLGLVDRKIAHLRHTLDVPGDKQYQAMAAEVMSRRPDLIILCAAQRWADLPLEKPAPDLRTNLNDVDRPLFDLLPAHGYRFVCRYPQGDGELALYSRPGFRVPSPLPVP